MPLTADIPAWTEYAAITTLKDWDVDIAYTREQRNALSSYVDMTTGKTPLKNLWMVEVAVELNTSAYMVSGYLRKVEKAYQREIENSMQRKTIFGPEHDADQHRKRCKRKIEEDETHKSILLSTERPFKRLCLSPTRHMLIRQQGESDVSDQVAKSTQEDDDNQYLDEIEEYPCFEGI